MQAEFMRLAIQEARRNLKKMDGGPFGAVIVKKGRVIACARNTVLASDATAHAEVNAIRQAARHLRDFDLSGCEIYSTTEPCPMCFSAIHWARIDKLIYGTYIRDVKELGFNELALSCRDLKRIGKSRVKIKSGFLRKECVELLKDWDRLENKRIY